MDENQLLESAGSNGELRFQPSQNISCFKRIAMEVTRETGNNLLIWAFDSLGYRQFKLATAGRARRLVPVTSTVPSTSTTAWTSIMTGCEPKVHGVYGTAFYVDEIGRTVSLLSREVAEESAGDRLTRFPWLSSKASPSLLTELRAQGFACTFMGLTSELAGLSFFHEICRDSELMPFPYDKRQEIEPSVATSRLADQVEAHLLNYRNRDERFCCVAFSDHVRYISEQGYTDTFIEAMTSLAERMRELRTRFDRLSILAVADHGMIRQRPRLKTPLIKDEEILRLSRHNPGGAGRILFFYPSEGCYAEMEALLTQRLGQSGFLLSRSEYVERYYGSEAYDTQRIGDLVAVAKDDAFPSASIDDMHEHGALSPEEMLSYIALL